MLHKIKQLIGLAPKTTLIKRHSFFNPFGPYSSTGVRRGSRQDWIVRLLVNAALTYFWFLVYPDHWIGWLIGALGVAWVGYSYWCWAAPKCNKCGERYTHQGGCEYDEFFRKYEARGWYAL